MCTERKATGLFVLTSFRCDNALGLDRLSKLVSALKPACDKMSEGTYLVCKIWCAEKLN